jgi:ATP-binding cassette subfamily C protein CydD
VILDEPFSSIDQETASVIYDHIRKYMSDKTVLIATQMTGFIRTDDKVLVLYQGVAVEYGPFSAMLHQGKKSYLFRMLSLNSLT